MSNSCATCRHHRAENRPTEISVAFDELIESSDETSPYYFCRVVQPEKEIGPLPILCDSFAAPAQQSSRMSELDAMIARRFGNKKE